MTYGLLILPSRKVAELGVASYGYWMGLNLWWASIRDLSALQWAGLGPDASGLFGQLFMTAAVLHALGTWINGRWRWSPLLRAVGLMGHMVLIFQMNWWALQIEGYSSAIPNYSWLLGAFSLALVGVIRDCNRAIRGRKPTWNI